MKDKKRDLLVTIANKDYIKQAKQLFSSVYHNSGWPGDYMLLAYDIPEKDLKWFRDKGILIYKCPEIKNKQIGLWTKILLSKFHLFKPFFKKWQTIIYLDSDIIIRCPLDNLTKIKGFAAVKDRAGKDIYFNLHKNESSLIKSLEKDYPARKMPFNAGVFAFNTNLISLNTLKNIKRLIKKYETINKTGDQLILNIYFSNSWESLPSIYNVLLSNNMREGYHNFNKMKGIIIHSNGKYKLWDKNSPLKGEWLGNLNKAELIVLSEPPKKQKPWSEVKIRFLSAKLILQYKKNSFYDKKIKSKWIIINTARKGKEFSARQIGKTGIAIKKVSPKTYIFLKKLLFKKIKS